MVHGDVRKMSKINKNLSLLQVVRAIAAILVVFFHATELFHVIYGVNYLGGVFKEGRIGVDLFFVLSGFIIYYIHHKDKNENGLAKQFFIKRLIRVYPIYWIILFGLIPVYLLVPAIGIGEAYSQLSTHIKAFLLIPQERGPLVVSWTLTSEILFYLMFGAMLFSKYKKVAITTFVSWMLLSALSIIFVPKNYVVNSLLYPTNIEFLYGMLVAYLVLNYHIKLEKVLILLGITGTIIAMFNAIHGYLEVNRIFAYGLPSALIILGCVSLELKQKVKTPKFLTFLGDSSYSIYLTHFPGLTFLDKVFIFLGIYNSMGYTLTLSLLISTTIMIGCVVHVLIEKPLLSLLRSKLLIKRTNQELIKSAA